MYMYTQYYIRNLDPGIFGCSLVFLSKSKTIPDHGWKISFLITLTHRRFAFFVF